MKNEQIEKIVSGIGEFLQDAAANHGLSTVRTKYSCGIREAAPKGGNPCFEKDGTFRIVIEGNRVMPTPDSRPI